MTKWDPKKEAKTMAERGLRFSDAEEVLLGPCHTAEDKRFDYGEARQVAIGPRRDGRLMVVVYTVRDDVVRIISLRKANKRDQAKYEKG